MRRAVEMRSHDVSMPCCLSLHAEHTFYEARFGQPLDTYLIMPSAAADLLGVAEKTHANWRYEGPDPLPTAERPSMAQHTPTEGGVMHKSLRGVHCVCRNTAFANASKARKYGPPRRFSPNLVRTSNVHENPVPYAQRPSPRGSWLEKRSVAQGCLEGREAGQ